ncbi:MAG: hypothetical protein AABX28_01945 [Nanoarchaeota archaeon]
MRTAKLEALNIEFPLKSGERFYDDGFVESVSEHQRGLDLQYADKEYGSEYESDGQCYPARTFGLFPKRICHIYYKKFGDDLYNLFVRAHEETHTLDYFNRLDLLEGKILRESKIKIKLRKIGRKALRKDDVEIIADIGGIHVMYQEGIIISATYSAATEYEKAKKIYLKALEDKTGLRLGYSILKNFAKNIY